jgi:hypothetical protein
MTADDEGRTWRFRIEEFAPLFGVIVRPPDGDTWIEASRALVQRYPAIATVPTVGPGRVVNDGIPYVSTRWLREHHREDAELQAFLARVVSQVDALTAEAEEKWEKRG